MFKIMKLFVLFLKNIACVKNSLRLHLAPMKPGAHLQVPETEAQTPPFKH